LTGPPTTALKRGVNEKISTAPQEPLSPGACILTSYKTGQNLGKIYLAVAGASA
jgi:hypothetical protein